MQLIPQFITRRISHRPNLVNIVWNIGWLFFDRVLRMGMGLIVGVWMARYLGPEQFGLLSFATAFTGLFAVIAVLGLNEIVVRDIVRDPDGARLTLGAAALLQLIGGLISFLVILVAISYARPDDALTRSIVAILGAMMLLKSSDIAVYWFESQVQSKYTVWAQNSAFLVFAVIKVLLILRQSPLIAFAWAMLGEAVVVAFVLLVVLGRKGPALSSLRAKTARVKTLLADSWPLALSAIVITLYMKIDQIMLGQMIGDEAVGIYSAAVRISEVWYFIPIVIVTSVFPAILEAKRRSEAQYHERLQKLYNLLVILSVAVALPMAFLSAPIVGLLFGEAYTEAGPVLAIHVWAAVFVSLGVASSKWYIAEGRQILALQRSVLGAFANVLLNFWLIPVYGPVGAAIATIISYGISAYLADIMQSGTRKMFLMKSIALTIPLIRKKQIARK